jgi:lysozyme
MIGIDVSTYQSVIDWDKAKAAGAQWAFIRACFGKSKDAQFDRNWSESKRVGIPRGAYGWVINGANQVDNANYFMSILGNDRGELQPACDFEKYQSGGVWKYPTFGELRTFVERVEVIDGRKPFIYTSTGYWKSLANSTTQTWAVKYPYWHAQYTSAATPVIPVPFPTWTFWQYSADGNGRGKEFGAQSSAIDINRFNGDMMDFQKLLGVEVIEPDPPIVPGNLGCCEVLQAQVNKLLEWARGIGYKG